MFSFNKEKSVLSAVNLLVNLVLWPVMVFALAVFVKISLILVNLGFRSAEWLMGQLF